MKNLIDQIRSNVDHYGTKYWKYHISGNVMELLVEAPYQMDRSTFRLAVIKIGMVLQALCKRIEKSEQNYLIQSFPALENLRVVAAIRIQKDEPKKNKQNEQAGNIPVHAVDDSPLDTMNRFAHENGLQLEELNRFKLKNTIKPKVFQDVKWYALTSEHDNPFTWIRIGYWQELVHQLHLSADPVKKPIIISESPLASNPDSGIEKEKYIQSLVALNP